MSDFDEALRNIDIFCKVLVRKIVDGENEESKDIIVEPIEKLMYRKYVIEEERDPSPSISHLIPLPQLEEPLVDVIEDEDHVKVLMQCNCRDQNVTIHPDIGSLEICKKECHKDPAGQEMCMDRCQKLDLPTRHLQTESIVSKCNNNAVFEIDIPKTKTAEDHDS